MNLFYIPYQFLSMRRTLPCHIQILMRTSMQTQSLIPIHTVQLPLFFLPGSMKPAVSVHEAVELTADNPQATAAVPVS